MKASEFTSEAAFGTNPKRTAREGSRPARGHNPEPRYKPVEEISDKTLTNYLTKVDADAQKHKTDPTKRPAHKANKSVSGFSKAFNKLDARKPDGSMGEGSRPPSGQGQAAYDRWKEENNKKFVKNVKRQKNPLAGSKEEAERIKKQGVAEGLSKQFEIIYQEQNGDRKRKIVSGTSKEAVARQFKKQYKLEIEQVKQLQQGVAEGEVVQFPKKHKSDLDSFDDCPKCGRDLMGGTYMGHRVKVCNPCKQVYLPPNSGIDKHGNKVDEIAGAFPSPSTRAKWAADAAASNKAMAAQEVERQRQANAAQAAKLAQNTQDVDRLNKVNYHGADAPKPSNATWDGDSDFLDLDGTQYAKASRMPISGDVPPDMKLYTTREGRQVYMWTRNSLKGNKGHYFYPAANPKTMGNESMMEHKKGVKAVIYNKKPKPVAGPEAFKANQKKREEAKKKPPVKKAPPKVDAHLGEASPGYEGISPDTKCNRCGTPYSQHFRFDAAGNIQSTTIRGMCGRPENFKPVAEQACSECGQIHEHGKASLSLCKSSKPDGELGASMLASCKSQGLRARDGNKSHKLGKGPESRVKVGGHRIKGHKYGGPLPDWS